jgi:hypothetical protein
MRQVEAQAKRGILPTHLVHRDIPSNKKNNGINVVDDTAYIQYCYSLVTVLTKLLAPLSGAPMHLGTKAKQSIHPYFVLVILRALD